MKDLKFGDVVEVGNDILGWDKRIFVSYENNGSIICVTNNCTKNFIGGEVEFRCHRWPKEKWRYKQLISDEVREKLKEAIDSGVELKFELDSEEQSAELQKFLFDNGCAWHTLDIDIEETDKKYLILGSDQLLLFADNGDEEYFNNLTNKHFDLKTGEYENDEYVPFSYEDSKQFLGKSAEYKQEGYKGTIVGCTLDNIEIGSCVCTYESFLNKWQFEDGSKCGKLKGQ